MMKKKMVIIIAAILLVATIGSFAVYHMIKVNAPLPQEIPFLPSELPVTVKIAYFDVQDTFWQVEVSEGDASTAISLYQKLDGKPRYHSDRTKDRNMPLYFYNKYIEENGGAVQFYFEEPISYNHSEICACTNTCIYATYDHIDLIYDDEDLLINFMLGEAVVASYNMQGSYLPSFREILAAYVPAISQE